MAMGRYQLVMAIFMTLHSPRLYGKTMENHHVQWEKSLFLWPFSIVYHLVMTNIAMGSGPQEQRFTELKDGDFSMANCSITRGYLLEHLGKCTQVNTIPFGNYNIVNSTHLLEIPCLFTHRPLRSKQYGNQVANVSGHERALARYQQEIIHGANKNQPS